MSKFGITDYEITEKNKESMTCYPFWKKNTQRVLNIGTAGGWTKPVQDILLKVLIKSTALVSTKGI
jgi:lycopene beta-cyclase